MDATRVPALARELALLDLDDGDGLLVPGERWSDRWDPREDCQDAVDLGWIGEDRDGINPITHQSSDDRRNNQ